jgi:hypothetical protein
LENPDHGDKNKEEAKTILAKAATAIAVAKSQCWPWLNKIIIANAFNLTWLSSNYQLKGGAEQVSFCTILFIFDP